MSSTKKTNKDKIYAQKHNNIDQFSFNKKVVDVFPDMIIRSVPGYSEIIDGIARLAEHFAQENSNIYDLGCSLGAASLAIARTTREHNCRIIGIDNSPDMVERCRRNLASYSYSENVEIIEGDITEIQLRKPSVVVMNFTLQFIPTEHRHALVTKIFNALLPGGVLITSEKIKHDNVRINDTLIKLHHDFKRENGYSDLEIAQKRTALENVMILDNPQVHHNRFEQAGFDASSVWFQNLNFASFVAVKK